MLLGIEIGGTKLQLGVGDGRGQILELARRDIDAAKGATAILQQIAAAAPDLIRRHHVSRVGFGFGGPVDRARGSVTTSHQVLGWDGFPLAAWCGEVLGVPAAIGNDCDVAALAEAAHGAGRGARSVFYVTVGTGIGGGYVLNGSLQGGGRPAMAEIGHLRPGLHCTDPHHTVESLASGPAIARAAIARLESGAEDGAAASDLLALAGGAAENVTAKVVAEAAGAGNPLARDVLVKALGALGWGIAQMITLLAPERVIVGGGVSLIGEALFFAPLREEVKRFVFPPLYGSYELLPAALGELAVVHGAVALAAQD